MAATTAQRMQLRPYQEEARQAVHERWEEDQHTLLVLPTGTGKTITFAKIAEDIVAQGGRVLILAHRGELLDQAADKIEQVTGLRTAREQAQETALDSWEQIVVGSVQTLAREKRLLEFEPDAFDAIIVDEAHHALSPSYRRILAHFSDAKVLGVTATPDRGDKQELGEVFDSIAYDYSLPRAIDEGYLSPIKALTLPLKIDLSGARMSAGDYQLSDIDHAIDPYLDEISRIIAEQFSDRKTLVFLPLIATSQKMTRYLQSYGMRAAEVNGESPDRAQILRDYAEGRYQILCNSMLLTEGYDCPDIDCVVPLRPTKIRSLYCQMVGRGTRIAPGKEDLLILDFLWHTGRHDLARPSYLIAPNEDIAKRMDKISSTSGEEQDLLELEEAAQASVVDEREESLRELLEKNQVKKSRYVDPIAYALSIYDADLMDYKPSFRWESDAPTENQLETLKRNGIDTVNVRTKGMAAMLLDRVIKRSKLGLSTPKQIRQLERRGFQHVGKWTKQDASVVIGMIAQNNWRTPAHLHPESYIPQSKREA